MEINCERLEFFFQRYNMCFVSEFFFRFGQIFFNLARTLLQRIMKNALFLPLLITYYIR